MHDFVRRTQEEILVARTRNVGEETAASSKRNLSDGDLEKRLKEEFTDYMKSIVTKQSTRSDNNKVQTREMRHQALQQILFEKNTGSTADLKVEDIASHIGKELRAGWKTG